MTQEQGGSHTPGVPPLMVSASYSVLREAMRQDYGKPDTWVRISPREAADIRRDMDAAREWMLTCAKARPEPSQPPYDEEN